MLYNGADFVERQAVASHCDWAAAAVDWLQLQRIGQYRRYGRGKKLQVRCLRDTVVTLLYILINIWVEVPEVSVSRT